MSGQQQDEMLTIRCWSNNHTGTGNRREGEFRVDPWVWNGLSESQRRKEVQSWLTDNDHFQWGYVDPEAGA